MVSIIHATEADIKLLDKELPACWAISGVTSKSALTVDNSSDNGFNASVALMALLLRLVLKSTRALLAWVNWSPVNCPKFSFSLNCRVISLVIGCRSPADKLPTTLVNDSFAPPAVFNAFCNSVAIFGTSFLNHPAKFFAFTFCLKPVKKPVPLCWPTEINWVRKLSINLLNNDLPILSPIKAISNLETAPPVVPIVEVNLFKVSIIQVIASTAPLTKSLLAKPIVNSSQAFFNLLSFVSKDSKVLPNCSSLAPDAVVAACTSSVVRA